MSRRGAVPVIMYHRVGPEIDDWSWSNSLTISPGTFEDHLRWLRKTGYHTASPEELHAHMTAGPPLPARSVVLTFDDGYIDNWTYVVPLLGRYGFRGAIAVVPEFVDPRDVVRPTLEDVWAGRLAESDLELRAFMSWAELKAASDRGTLSVMSHSLTHTWFPTGPRVVDFHHPGDAHYWLDWNRRPEHKPFYLEHPNESAVPWGTPVYEHARALELTRYFPDAGEAAHLSEFVASNGDAAFFRSPDWRDTLHALVDKRRDAVALEDRLESDGERRERYESELRTSRTIIEERLAIPAPHFLWPGQVFSAEAMEMARSIYDMVDASVGSTGLRRFNRPGEEPGLFRRVGVPDIEQPGRIHYPGGRYFIGCLEEFRGVPMARRRRQGMKVLALARIKLGMSRVPGGHGNA